MHRFRFLLVCGGICLAFLTGEGMLRCYRFFFISPHIPDGLITGKSQKEYPNDPELMNDIPGLFIPDPKVGHRYRPGAEVRWRGVNYKINVQGWRGPDWLKVKDKDDVILCLGDSITFGYGVPYEDTFCHRLQGLLKEKFPKRPPIVLNASSSDYNLDAELHIFKELLPIWKPDIVIVNFYKDDVHPEAFGVDEKGRLYASPLFDSWYTFLHNHSLLLKFLEQRITLLTHLWVLQSPRAVSWSEEARRWQEAEQTLQELVQSARQSHMQVVFVYFPDYFEGGILKVSPYFYRFRRIAQNLQVPLVDMQDILKRAPNEKLFVDMCHLNKRGHELAASDLVKRVEPLLKK